MVYSTVYMLVQMNEERLLEPLLEALHHPNRRKRWRAADALGRLGDRRAVEPLIAVLSSDAASLREYAAKALAAIGDGLASPALLERLKDGNEDHDVRREAAVALGRLGGRRAIEAIQPLLLHENGRVSGAAANAIDDIRLGALRAWYDHSNTNCAWQRQR